MTARRVIACVSLALVAAGALLIGVNCSSSLGDAAVEPAPIPMPKVDCARVYGERCGSVCAGDIDCGSGLYCGDGRCSADCVPDQATCAEGQSCGMNGRCSTSGGRNVFGGNQDASIIDGGGAIDLDSSCADIDVSFDKVTPTIILLIDQSGSMNELTADGIERWTALRNALMNVDGGVVKALENDVKFGLALYQWDPRVDPVCPMIVSVGTKFGNHAEISRVYYDAGYKDNTPTGESILKVAGVTDAGAKIDGGFASQDAGGPKIIVLATDGDPDMCSNGDSNGTDPPRRLSVLAAQRAYQNGIRTVVIAVGDQISEGHQRQVANAGAGRDGGLDAGPDAGGAVYYRVNDQAAITRAFRDIITGQRSCTFTLRGEVVAGTEDQGRVTLNGGALTRNDPNGWRLNGRSEIELLGTACTTVKTATDANLGVRFPCGAVVNIPQIPR